jgi:hypothetical protein
MILPISNMENNNYQESWEEIIGVSWLISEE